jgi:peptidoglycan/LPS O-acetylase OafA/YrhL
MRSDAPAKLPAIHSLTGLRFIAALAVVMFHMVSPPEWPAFVGRWFARGHVSVQLFFVLSGFILAYNYLGSDKPVERGPFWRARFARIYPVYLVAVVLAAPFAWRTLTVTYGYPFDLAAVHLVALAAAVGLMLQAFFPVPELVQAWNTPAWSLSCEMFFYALFPWAGPRLARLSRRGLWVALLAVGALMGVGHALVLPAMPPHASLWIFSGAPIWIQHPFFNLPLFLGGILLGRLYLLSRGGPFGRWAGTVASVASVATLVYLGLPAGAHYEAYFIPCLVPLLAVLLFALAWDRGPAAWLLSRKPMVLLGESSYALYILHSPVWGFFNYFWSHVLHLDPLSRLYHLAYTATVVAVSVAAYLLIERPARTWLSARLKGKPRDARPAPGQLGAA